MNKWMIMCLTCLSMQVQAQKTQLLQAYRSQVKEYNQDIRASRYAVSMQQEKKKSAKADFLPSLSGNADLRYTGNPASLDVSVPSLNEMIHFQGRNTQYGASLSLVQPVYSGGALKAGYEKARTEHELSQYEQQCIINNVLYEADVYYWKKVASQEIAAVNRAYRESVAMLVTVVKDRVEEGYTDRNDLLMAEVKLNDAEYRLTQSYNDAEVARMSMNSFSGIPFEEEIRTDSVVVALTEVQQIPGAMEYALFSRPELQIAIRQTAIQTSAVRIANAHYLPQFSIGFDGNFSSPGYDFTRDPDPNYVVYARLSIPVFEWGKRKYTRRSGRYSVNIARENQQKITDHIRLEIETALYTYSQAVQKVILTESSLAKAADNERLTMDKYKEGNISIVEVINAQLYHLDARINYIQSKLNAQIARSNVERATGQIDIPIN